MPNKYELFRSSLSVPMFENINQSLFKLLQTPEYQRYTDIVFSTLGQELERYFGKDMIFKYAIIWYIGLNILLLFLLCLFLTIQFLFC